MSSHQNPLLIQPDRPLPGSVAIIGAGTIGPDLAYYLKSAIPGLELVLIDIAQDALDRATQRIEGHISKGLKRGKLTPQQADGVRENLTTSLDYAAMAPCDWVLEAATENLELKRKIFSEVESIVGPHALITSNTSSLPAARLFSHLEHPERATVTHFFAPAFRNPIVEVVDWEQADPDTIAWLRGLFCVTGKVPLVTTDAVCFMLDRIFDNWCNEAGYLLEQASAGEIDSVSREFVHAGPFFVLNMANGNPIIIEANTLQASEEGEHYRPAPIFGSVDRWRTLSSGEALKVPAAKAGKIRDRLLGILFSQSVDILDRDIGTKADLDLGCRLALGFKAGPLALMESTGGTRSARILAQLAADRPGMPMPSHSLEYYSDFRRYVLVDRIDNVCIITLRRPEALNALHDELNDEILEVIRSYEDDPETHGFVITGYGVRAFSAGADIGKFPSMLGDAQAAAEYSRACSRVLSHLDRMQKPVVAALNGMALGGGLELAIRCHGLIAVKDAWMQFPEITLGIVPGIGAMVVPYRRWPQASAAFHAMLRQARKLEAPQALELGILDAVVDDHQALLQQAVDLVEQLVESPRHIPEQAVSVAAWSDSDAQSTDGQALSREVLGIMERAIQQAAAANSLAEALETGYAAFGASACTAAAREGIDAFLEHRLPDFRQTG
ncbi:MAG: enoyl-CoA hydratase/isomerase family protein [Proteobacteria bacterium]|nr:enoyl-CoA hydratase/isomerase family protein [Pseudomonadota bacterium]